MSFQEAFHSSKFLVTAEVGPEKGTEVDHILKEAIAIKDYVDAINVTDQQSSVMRLGSMAVSHLLQDSGIDPILQMTCRDRNRLALQSDLLSAWALGIKREISPGLNLRSGLDRILLKQLLHRLQIAPQQNG